LTRNGANVIGGGLLNQGTGTVTITHTTFDRNAVGLEFGGGLANIGGTVTIANSTFVRNLANQGGGIFNGLEPQTLAILTLTNTTVAQNRTRGAGAGVANNGFAVLQSTTVAQNHAEGGISGPGGVVNGGTLLLQNTIIAHNDFSFPGGSIDSDCAGALTSLGNNLVGDPTGCTITLQPSDLTGDPGLDTFTDNGKPGNGHFPLLSTSQAIDAGDNAVCPKRDQLGRRRIGPCDIGAIRFLDGTDRKDKEQDDQQEEDLAATAEGSQ
jgi:hypothetical protein